MNRRIMANIRRSERYRKVGEERENLIADILEKSGKFFKVIHHEKWSQPDMNGKDFTCCKIIDGKHISKSFGVTISNKSWKKSKNMHPGVIQIYFPINTKPETIIKRIESLFC